MLELFRNAWMGWIAYIQYGKLAALFLAVLLFLWFYKRVAAPAQKPFVLYATGLGIACICPLTAGLLMWYQTRFYDYEWIWSAVPVTALTAFGLTFVFTELWGEGKQAGSLEETGTERETERKAERKAGNEAGGNVPGGKGRFTRAAVTALLLGIMVLCGSLGTGKWDSTGQQEERTKAYRMAELLREEQGEEEICLWAPVEILEYVREADASVCLLYGRNMWDLTLNGYSYDVYGEEEILLYEFMEALKKPEYELKWFLEEQGIVYSGNGAARDAAEAGQKAAEAGQKAADEEAFAFARKCAAIARNAGVNFILLPAESTFGMVQEMASVFGSEPKQVEEYWMIYE